MSASFEAGAVYVPRFFRDGRAVAAPDEDVFTLAVAALEALPGLAAGPVARVHWVGPADGFVDWAVPAFVGGSVPVEHHEPTRAGFVGAVHAAEHASDGATEVVLLAERSGPHGAQGIALRYGPNPSPHRPRWEGDEDAPGSIARAGLVGIGSGPPPPGAITEPPDPERAAAFFDLAPTHVSEGAYVPRPRYLENLPSRWRLEADRCGHCGSLTFPRRGRCRSCGRSDRLSLSALPRDGARVVAATTIGKGGQPTEFDDQVEALGPYEVVLAELAPGLRLTLQVADAAPGSLGIGDTVDTRLRRLYPMEGEWRYGRKAVPPAG